MHTAGIEHPHSSEISDSSSLPNSRFITMYHPERYNNQSQLILAETSGKIRRVTSKAISKLAKKMDLSWSSFNFIFPRHGRMCSGPRRWHNKVNKCVRECDVDANETRELVNDRVKWKECTRSICEDNTSFLLDNHHEVPLHCNVNQFYRCCCCSCFNPWFTWFREPGGP